MTEAKKDKPPPATFSAPPESGLEEVLKKRPFDKDLKTDVGSDESMDASDPPSIVRADSDEPATSSGFRE